MTMSEIAALAGVSVSTVSKAFSGSGEISDNVRERIFTIAKEHNCYDKYVKAVKNKYVIGVITPEFKSGYYTQHLVCFEEEIKKRGGMMITADFNFDEEEREELFLYFSKTVKADGIITYGTFDKNPATSVPVVNIGNSDEFDSIVLSLKNAMADAVKHLAENGHRRIAYIGEALTVDSQENFAEAMNKAGLDIYDELIITASGSRFEEAGYAATNKLLSLEHPPTAIITAYDYIAFGAIRAIAQKGLKIPEDISIIGRDDVKECKYFDVPLTTISPYSADLCEIVVDRLFEKIKSKNKTEPKTIKISHELIKRGSVGKAK